MQGLTATVIYKSAGADGLFHVINIKLFMHPWGNRSKYLCSTPSPDITAGYPVRGRIFLRKTVSQGSGAVKDIVPGIQKPHCLKLVKLRNLELCKQTDDPVHEIRSVNQVSKQVCNTSVPGNIIPCHAVH